MSAKLPVENAQKTPSDIIIGKKYSLTSTVLGEERPYWVYLPASYEDTTYAAKHYPVLYLLDGDWNFHTASGVLQHMGNINMSQIPELIMVALPNTDRSRDLTPTHSKQLPNGKETKEFETSGGGDKFLTFMRDELLPHIKANYRTEPYNILVGHSLGGLITLHAMLTLPELFQAYLAIDSSLWWDDLLLVKQLEQHQKSLQGAVYMSVANHTLGEELDPDKMEASAKAFAKELERFKNETFRFKLEHFPNDDHGTVPLLSLYHGLLYIFEGYKPPRNVVESPDILVKHFEKLAKKLAVDSRSPEAFTDMIGHVVLEYFENVDRAIEFFKLNVANYPNSANVYASLAKAYEIKGDKQQAIMQLQKSLELNPENQSVKDQLQKLRED
jgi:uncharacterized protein